MVSEMRPTRITCIVLVFIAVLVLAFSMPAGAFDGASASASAYGSTGSYYSGWDGNRGGGWNQEGWPNQQWQSQGWGNRYPYNYQGGGYFSNCYSRCISQGYGPDYCAQVCPV